jgi:hypothetical protein
MTTKEIMHECLGKVLKALQKRIAIDLAQGKNIGMCLDAYNLWQDDERDGINYVFNIDNANDLKYLVAHDMISASGIAWVNKQKSHLFMFDGEKDAGIKIIQMDELIEMLSNTANEYMAYAIMYVGRCGEDSAYAAIYDEYVTIYLEDYFE